jgi:hypothetical protein
VQPIREASSLLTSGPFNPELSFVGDKPAGLNEKTGCTVDRIVISGKVNQASTEGGEERGDERGQAAGRAAGHGQQKATGAAGAAGGIDN